MLSSTLDVAIITIIILLPLTLARLEPIARNAASDPNGFTFWSIFVSGQLGLLAIGSLARIALLCLRKGLPETIRVIFGGASFVALAVVTWLIGIDPKFEQAPNTFVGPLTGYLFAAAQTAAILVTAISKMDHLDAPRAAEKQVEHLTDRLEAQNPETREQNG